MPDYTFYKEQFAGEDIPESEFPRFLKRAEIELKRMRRIYPMTPAGAYTEDAAAAMALCAIADAMYEFAQEDERRGLARVSIGSVSETYTAPPELCARTLDDRARHYRREAGYYYNIGRWVNDG